MHVLYSFLISVAVFFCILIIGTFLIGTMYQVGNLAIIGLLPIAFILSGAIFISLGSKSTRDKRKILGLWIIVASAFAFPFLAYSLGLTGIVLTILIVAAGIIIVIRAK